MFKITEQLICDLEHKLRLDEAATGELESDWSVASASACCLSVNMQKHHSTVISTDV